MDKSDVDYPHGKGSLARLQNKVEHQRVLQGPIGQRLLEQLLLDRVLELRGNFYHWVPETAAAMIDVSWLDLRQGRSSTTLGRYLKAFIDQHPALFT